jgi:hypothetical protein
LTKIQIGSRPNHQSPPLPPPPPLPPLPPPPPILKLLAMCFYAMLCHGT